MEGVRVVDDDEEKTSCRDPLLTNPPQKGGLRTLPFIIANEAFEKVASLGLVPNMVVYLTREYGMETPTATNVIFIWSASVNFMPILGAFLADSCVGRFPMIGFGSIFTLLGMFLLWLTTVLPQARPPPCPKFGSCESATAPQLLFLYSSLAFMSIGAGGIRSSSLAFGAEQLQRSKTGSPKNMLESFFSWYYAIATSASIFAVTCIVYIQDALGWQVGFGVPVMLMILSAVSFFSASPMYVKSKPKPSLFTGYAQVLVASYRNRSIELSSRDPDAIMYYHRKGAKLLVPSDKLRFLNKACIIRNPEEDLTLEGKPSDPWSLCSIDQVEELKRVIRIIPIWSAGMLTSVNASQNSFPVLQASTMDRHITTKFEIPAASFIVFMVLSMVTWIALYDRVIVPLASKIKGKRVGLSLKQRMGIGILFSCASTVAFAVLETVRRRTAIEEGFRDDPAAVVHVSAMWLIPHYALNGLAEAFNQIGQNEFYYTELSKSMSSVASALFQLGLSGANLIASWVTDLIDGITRRGGGESWISSNINKGHYDYYFWFLACLSLIVFAYYVVCCKFYGPCRGEDGNALDEEDDMGDN